MADYVVTQTYRMDNQVSTAAQAATADLNKMADASDTVSVKVTATGRSTAALVNSLDPLSRAAKAVTAAMQQQAQVQAAYNDAIASGSDKTEALGRALDAANGKVAAAQATLAGLRGAAQALPPTLQAVVGGLNDVVSAQRRLAEVQATVNQFAGMGDTTDYEARAKDIAAYGDEMDRLRAKYDPLYAASKQYSDTLAEIEQAQKTGAISAGVAQQATDRVTQAFAAANGATKGLSASQDQATTSAGAQAFALRQLGVQSVQAISGIASGQPVLTTFVQQGHQVLDVALSTGSGFELLGAAAKAVGAAVFSPIGAMVAFGAAIGTVIYAATRFNDTNREMTTTIAAVGRTADLAASQLTGYVHALTLQGASKADATSIVNSLSRNPALSGSAIGQVAGLTPDTAVALGTDDVTAAKAIGDAASGSYSAIQKLDSALNFLTVDQQAQIRTMLEHGDRIDAVRIAMDALGKRVDGLRQDNLSPMQSSIEGLSRSWDGFMDSITSSSAFQAAVKTLQLTLDLMNKVASIGATTPSSAAGDVAALQAELARATASPGTSTPAYVAGLRQQLADAQARSMLTGNPIVGGAAAAPELPTSLPLPGSPGFIGPAAPTDDQVQAKKVDELTQSYQDQQKVLAVGLAQRPALIAQLAAEREAVANNLSGDQAAALEKARVAEALAKESDARGQEAAAISRAGQAALSEAAASQQGRAAMILATAAAEAHEKAVTEAGVAESDLASRIVNRDAAQQAAKGADTIVSLNEQVAATKALIAAQAAGPQATYYAQVEEKVRAATVDLAAYRDATTDPAIKAALTQQIASIGDLTRAQANLNTVVQLNGEQQNDQNQIDYLNTETGLLSDTEGYRNRELALLTKRQELLKDGVDLNSDYAQGILKTAAALADVGTANRQQQQAISDLSNMATQAFDQVGTAISDAFIGGTGQAVNFGNVASAVISSVLQQMLKLAIINPLLNSVLGTSNTTLASALAVVSGSGSTSSSSSSSSLGSLSSLSDLSKLLTSGSGSISPGLDAFAQSSLGFGQISNFTGQAAGAVGPFVQPSLGLANGGSALAGFSSLSNVAGIAGAVLPGIINGNAGQAIAGGVGAAIGTAILPGIGTILGGIAGNLLGDLFGPGPAHHGYSWQLQGNGAGGIGVSNTHVDPVAQQQFDQEQQELASINSFLTSNGISATGLYEVGGNNNNPNQTATLDAGFDRFRFNSDSDPLLNGALNGKSFASPTDLQAAVTAVQQFEAALPGLLDPLGKTTTSVGSLQAAIDQINTTYSTAITQAASYGRATDDLVAAQQQAIQAQKDAADQSVQSTLQGFTERALAATAGGSLAASLMQFDDQAQQQRDAFQQQLTALYGTAYTTSASYAAQMLTLDTTLSAERLKVEQQYYDQGRQQVIGVIQSLTQFTSSLALGSNSPLSAQDQYAYASSRFQSIDQAALGGDFTSLQQLQGAAQDFLTASRTLNGSGTQYAQDYASVTAALGAIADASSDQLTAAAMQQIQQTASDQLTQALQALGATVTGATIDSGVNVASSIYTGLDSITAGLVASNDNSTAALIANFQAIAQAISTSAVPALDEAALFRVQDYETTRIVNALGDLGTKMDAVRTEIQQLAAAPAGISYGGGYSSGGGGDGGSGS